MNGIFREIAAEVLYAIDYQAHLATSGVLDRQFLDHHVKPSQVQNHYILALGHIAKNNVPKVVYLRAQEWLLCLFVSLCREWPWRGVKFFSHPLKRINALGSMPACKDAN